MLVLSRREIRQAVTMAEAVPAVERAFGAFSAGETVTPIRTPVKVPEYHGVSLFMPGYVPALAALGMKAVSVFGDNPARGKPTINALALLLDPESGEPLAVLEAGYLTAIRTGAATGVAAKYLARADARVAAVFGAGIQARTQLAGIMAVRPVKEVRVYDLNPAAVESYIREMAAELADPELAWVAAATPAAAVTGADVVLTATTSTRPVFPGDRLEPGVHISGVGSYTPQMQEVDETTLLRADKVVVDSVEAAWEEAGDLIIPLEQGRITRSIVYAEIGEIIAGKKPGRESEKEITFFKTVGLAVQDMAVARLVYDRAVAGKLGTWVDLD